MSWTRHAFVTGCLLGTWSSAVACPEFTEFDLRLLVSESQEAIYRDDVLSHRRLAGELEQGLPCLNTQLPRDVWAKWLIDEAIVAHATGENWKIPLGIALRLVPELENVPDYLVDGYVPLPPLELRPDPVPVGRVLFVDGVLMPWAPRWLHGPHVIQLYQDATWQTLYLPTGGTVPDAWLAPEPGTQTVGPSTAESALDASEWRPVIRGYAGLRMGFGAESQSISVSLDWLANQSRLAPGATLEGELMLPVVTAGKVAAGIGVDGAATIEFPSVRRELGKDYILEPSGILSPDGYIGAGVQGALVQAWAGAGAAQLRVVEGGVRRTWTFPQPHVSVAMVGPAADISVGGGWTPSAAHARLRSGGIVRHEVPVVRVGGTASVVQGWFEEASPGERTALVLHTEFGVSASVAWGR